MVKKLYEVLELSHENADAADVRKNYRRLALKYHPDKNPNGEQQFKEITAAYEILGDEDKRQKYNQGTINEKGEPIFKASPQPAPKHTTSFPQSQPTKHKPQERTAPPKESVFNNPHSFHQPQPAYYFFFNSEKEAATFQPKRTRRNIFTYVTPSPLDILLTTLKSHTANEDTLGYKKPTKPIMQSTSNALLIYY